jgi:hypothetical protein
MKRPNKVKFDDDEQIVNRTEGIERLSKKKRMEVDRLVKVSKARALEQAANRILKHTRGL